MSINAEKYGKVFEGLGFVLKGFVDVPTGGIRILAVVGKFWGSQKSDEIKKALISLESLLNDLEKTYGTLTQYTDEDRRDSRLTLEVKVALKSCSDWADQIEGKRISSSLFADIESKSKSLNFAISQEVLEQTVRINQKAKLLVALQSLDKKKAWEYYDDAKYLINQKRWLEAKTNLLAYRSYVESKTPIMSDKNPDGIREPSKDNHLKMLEYVQNQLNAQGQKEEPDPILSAVPQNAPNRYHKLWVDWQALHMKS